MPTLLTVFLIVDSSLSFSKKKLMQEFEAIGDFEINIIPIKEPYKEINYWFAICKAVEYSIDKEFIIVCSAEHRFTKAYNTMQFLFDIELLRDIEPDILCCGVSWFDSIVPVNRNIFWMDNFKGKEFIVLYKRIFQRILCSKFYDSYCVEDMLSSISEHIFLLYPFISAKPIENNSIENDPSRRNYEYCELRLRDIKSILDFYKETNIYIPEGAGHEEYTIPTYIINLPERQERKKHIENQFFNKNEFDVHFINGIKHEIGAVGLWKTIRYIIGMASENDEDVIIICEDDHEFTKDYSKDNLILNILEAHNQSIDYISGGSAGIYHTLPVTKNRFWGSLFLSTQFIVVFNRFFKKIMDYDFDNDVVADRVLSRLTINKALMFPFISIQKDFGYSDVTQIHHDNIGFLSNLFNDTQKKLEKVQRAANRYFYQK